MADSKLIPQHKRLASGAGPAGLGFKKGGSVKAPPSKPTPGAVNPLLGSKMSNGIPGMKKGGKC
jgi:hypothetical protein